MTLNELKQKIAESPNKEWYQKYELTLNYTHVNYKVSLKGVSAIYEFALKQIEGFTKYPSLPEELNRNKRRFSSVRESLLTLITNNNIYANNWDDNLRDIKNNSPFVFLYDFPETEFLIKVHLEKPQSFKGAYEYFTGQINNANNKENFIGYLLAYEFTSKDFSSIVERKDSEKKSISTVRADFQTKLGDAETHLTEYLAQANQKVIDTSQIIDALKLEKEKTINTWFKTTSDNFLKFSKDSTQSIKDFEDLYKEKLKLEAPAQYWSDRAKKLRSEGNKWLIGLITSVLVGVGLLIWCLSEISAGTLDKIFQNNGTAIKWSVVFITLISFIAFAIKIFSKLTFSSYHLVRDAEEREQLTYVYLALKKEKNIDETERHLIMQSLFSRADSGLLKDDGGPTMPGNIANNMISK